MFWNKVWFLLVTQWEPLVCIKVFNVLFGVLYIDDCTDNPKVGCIICGTLCDTLGCIATLQYACLIWISGTALAVFLVNIYMLVLARLFKGTAVGFISTVIPVYVVEALPDERRGMTLSIVQLSSSCGALALYYIGYVFQTYISSDLSFRYTWAVEAIPTLLFLLLSFFLPESPKWFASRSKWVEAATILDRLNKHNSQKRGEREVMGDKQYVLSAYTAQPEVKKGTFADLFGREYWKYTVIGISIQLLVQFAGVTTFMYFFVYICGICGLEEKDRVWTVSLQYVTLSAFTLFPILLVDSCRRKDAMVFGFFILGAAYACIWALILVYTNENLRVELVPNSPFNSGITDEPASAVLALFLFLVAVFSTSIQSVSWLYTGEIFPISIRSKGSAICMGVSWALNMCLTLLMPMLLNFLTYWVFGIFSILCLGASIILLSFPETRDLNAVQLELLYTSNVMVNCQVISDTCTSSALDNEPLVNRFNAVDLSDMKSKQSTLLEKEEAKFEYSNNNGKEYLTETDKLIMEELKDRTNLYENINSATSKNSSSLELPTAKGIMSKAIKLEIPKEPTIENERSKSKKRNISGVSTNEYKDAIATPERQSTIGTNSVTNDSESYYSNDWHLENKTASSMPNKPYIIPGALTTLSTISDNIGTSQPGITYEPAAFLRQNNQHNLVVRNSPLQQETRLQIEKFSKNPSLRNNARFGSNKNIMNTIARTNNQEEIHSDVE